MLPLIWKTALFWLGVEGATRLSSVGPFQDTPSCGLQMFPFFGVALWRENLSFVLRLEGRKKEETPVRTHKTKRKGGGERGENFQGQR